MTSKSRKVLSIAAAAGKIGMVYLIDGELMDWELSSCAALSTDQTARKAAKWIEFYRPDQVVIEKITPHSRKSTHTHALISAIGKVANTYSTKLVAVERVPTHANKFEEIKELCIQFPQIAHHAPKKPEIWMPEPKATIYFEALSMAVQLGIAPPNLPQ